MSRTIRPWERVNGHTFKMTCIRMKRYATGFDSLRHANGGRKHGNQTSSDNFSCPTRGALTLGREFSVRLRFLLQVYLGDICLACRSGRQEVNSTLMRFFFFFYLYGCIRRYTSKSCGASSASNLLNLLGTSTPRQRK